MIDEQSAYDIYKGPFQTKDENGKVITDGTTPIDPAVLFRRIFGRSRLVNVEFMGVWDTVSSLGTSTVYRRKIFADIQAELVCRVRPTLSHRVS